MGVVVGTALLAGCSDAEGDADPGGDGSPSGEVSSESSGPTGTAEVPVVPELPAEALGDDDAAAVAFVEHWVDLVNYAFESGDAEPASLLGPDCETCHVIADGAAEAAAQGDTGRWTLLSTAAFDPAGGDEEVADLIVVATVNVEASDEGANGDLTFGLHRQGTGWTIAVLDAAAL
ncbi:MAG TPA: DUF6318 family protein [Nocardioides sp.]